MFLHLVLTDNDFSPEAVFLCSSGMSIAVTLDSSKSLMSKSDYWIVVGAEWPSV